MIALYGGTFDPFHNGHLHVVRWLMDHLRPDTLLVVPNYQNPLKSTGSDGSDGPVAAVHRLEMVRLGLETLHNPRVEVSNQEALNPSPSFTVDTVEHFSRHYKKPVVLCIGTDSAIHFAQWKSHPRILELASLLIVRRDPHFSLEALAASLRLQCVNPSEIRLPDERFIRVAEIGPLPLSATRLRADIANYWRCSKTTPGPQGVQESVWLYIKVNRLYADPPVG